MQAASDAARVAVWGRAASSRSVCQRAGEPAQGRYNRPAAHNGPERLGHDAARTRRGPGWTARATPGAEQEHAGTTCTANVAVVQELGVVVAGVTAALSCMFPSSTPGWS